MCGVRVARRRKCWSIWLRKAFGHLTHALQPSPSPSWIPTGPDWCVQGSARYHAVLCSRVSLLPQDIMHISADFKITRENFKATVFRPGHRLPTMSLEEYADKEVADAIERGQREKYGLQLGVVSMDYGHMLILYCHIAGRLRRRE